MHNYGSCTSFLFFFFFLFSRRKCWIAKFRFHSRREVFFPPKSTIAELSAWLWGFLCSWFFCVIIDISATLCRPYQNWSPFVRVFECSFIQGERRERSDESKMKKHSPFVNASHWKHFWSFSFLLSFCLAFLYFFWAFFWVKRST